jgi:hypothetical protein
MSRGIANVLARVPDELEMEHRYIASTQRVRPSTW